MHHLGRVVVVGDEQVGKSTLIATLGGIPHPEPAPDERGIPATLLDSVAVEVRYVIFAVYAPPFTPASWASNLCIR